MAGFRLSIILVRAPVLKRSSMILIQIEQDLQFDASSQVTVKTQIGHKAEKAKSNDSSFQARVKINQQIGYLDFKYNFDSRSHDLFEYSATLLRN